jgi:hypothetical protein
MIGMRINRLLVLMVLAAAVTLALATLVPVASAATNGPRLRGLGPETSTNWAGYDATQATNSSSTFTSVSASWVVPAVSTAPTNAYASFWVGLDGDGSNSVEQIGTDSDYVNGQASYYAWYEMYPKMPVNLSLAVKPGDTISASVVAGTKGSFTLTLTDATTGASFTTTQKSAKAKLYSAEVIAEAPWSGGVLPLADFGSVAFTNALFNGQPISSFANNQITMVTSSGAPKATPSVLKSTKSGSAFSVTWNGY